MHGQRYWVETGKIANALNDAAVVSAADEKRNLMMASSA